MHGFNTRVQVHLGQGAHVTKGTFFNDTDGGGQVQLGDLGPVEGEGTDGLQTFIQLDLSEASEPFQGRMPQFFDGIRQDDLGDGFISSIDLVDGRDRNTFYSAGDLQLFITAGVLVHVSFAVGDGKAQLALWRICLHVGIIAASDLLHIRGVDITRGVLEQDLEDKVAGDLGQGLLFDGKTLVDGEEGHTNVIPFPLGVGQGLALDALVDQVAVPVIGQALPTVDIDGVFTLGTNAGGSFHVHDLDFITAGFRGYADINVFRDDVAGGDVHFQRVGDPSTVQMVDDTVFRLFGDSDRPHGCGVIGIIIRRKEDHVRILRNTDRAVFLDLELIIGQRGDIIVSETQVEDLKIAARGGLQLVFCQLDRVIVILLSKGAKKPVMGLGFDPAGGVFAQEEPVGIGNGGLLQHILTTHVHPLVL